MTSSNKKRRCWKNYEANISFKDDKEQVLKLQSLEGYSDQQGAEYWSGKTLDEYLNTRIKDKIKDLKKYGDS